MKNKDKAKLIYAVFVFVILFVIIGMAPFVSTSSKKATAKSLPTDTNKKCEGSEHSKTQHSETQKKIALTFDDGPHNKYTEEILDILAEYDIKATFFVVGKNVQSYPDIIKRIFDEGHEIGNHTYSHPKIKNESLNDILIELVQTENVIEDITGYKTDLFRPPQGVCTDSVKMVAKERNYYVVLWTIDTRDWTNKSSRDISKCIMKEAKDGSVILMHDFIAKNSPTPNALRNIIPKLMEEGYSFVTVSEIINKKVGTR